MSVSVEEINPAIINYVKNTKPQFEKAMTVQMLWKYGPQS